MANAAITIDLNAKIANFETELKRATGTLDSFEKKGSAALATFKSFGAGLVGALSVGAITSFAKAGIDAADALNDMSQRLGVSVKDLASFKLAAEQSGTSLDGVGAGIARLTRSIGEAEGGNKKLAAALGALGITARDPKEAFFQLADAVERIQDPSERAALLSQVLGKSYQDLIPLLVQGGAALRESARQSETFADAMARLAPQADQFNDQLALLKNNVAGLAATVLSKLVPSFNEWIAVGQEVVKTGSLLDKVRFFALGNASDEMVGRVRKMAAESAAAAKKAREAIGKIDAPIARAQPARKTRAVARVASDPLAGLLGQTDIGRMAAFDKQVALLNARFDGGRKNTELYEQAMTKLVETSFADNFKQFADDQEFMNLVMQDGQDTINETNRSTEEWKATVAATSKELLYMVNPTARLVDQLEELDKFDGFMDPELLDEARLEINAQIDSVNGLGKEIDKTKSFGEEFGLTMKSAFEDAVIEGKDLRDVLGGVASDLQRIVLRKTITEPLGNAFSGLLDGIDFGSLFGFANGGIMTGAGPLPLNTYATGGIASSPQFALFGEGRMNEAFVPLPDGRSIPVTMSGGGGQVILQQTIQIDARGADSGVEARIRQAAADGARQGYSMVVDDLSRGGPVARLVGRA